MIQAATVAYALGILGLFALGRDSNAHTSKALWLPVLWLLINGSRPISLWLQIGPRISSGDGNVEGSPLDALVFGIILVAGLVVLTGRQRQVGAFLQANLPIVLFFVYCAVSTLWSDYTGVAFKRWIKAIGDLVMIIIVVTDPEPSDAIKRLMSRVGFVLIPVSILLIKYYPDLSRYYSRWEGRMFVSGVTEDKNMLGMTCLVFGLGAWWQFLGAFRDKRGRERTRQLIAYGSVVAMAVWLFSVADSMTSLSCFIMAGSLMTLTCMVRRPRLPAVVHVLGVAMVCASISALFLDVGGGALQTMGRDPTLTGRTEIWKQLLSNSENSLLGTGFESFWLGEHRKMIRAMGGLVEGVNEAHNGYLEVYLNLGVTGVILLTLLLVTGYRNVNLAFRDDQDRGRLFLALFMATVVYCLTEAAFKMMCPIWFAFLLSISRLPNSGVAEERSVSKIEEVDPFARWGSLNGKESVC